ncbi:hypothetical protein [Rhizobium leguminosarum]|uniref:hypothetical protein n=1 Tax=Rhizobium leguminosarum TaxID=384 RepID=UPI003F9BAF39
MRNEIEITGEVIEAGRMPSPNFKVMRGESAEGHVPRGDPFHPGGGVESSAPTASGASAICGFRGRIVPIFLVIPAGGPASFGAKSYRPYISRAALYARSNTAIVTI